MIIPTPETATIIAEMETPVSIARDEIAQQRANFDLPDANHATDISTFNPPSDDDSDEDTNDSFDEESNDAEIPGDPRPPHELQPPTRDAY